jgi:hypothetical protein
VFAPYLLVSLFRIDSYLNVVVSVAVIVVVVSVSAVDCIITKIVVIYKFVSTFLSM